MNRKDQAIIIVYQHRTFVVTDQKTSTNDKFKISKLVRLQKEEIGKKDGILVIKQKRVNGAFSLKETRISRWI